ncbi:hypothetical protein DSECCO2_424140 [anaerobic digester metagenome]
MGPSMIGRIDEVHVSCSHFHRARPDKILHALAHGTQVHRDVGGICYQVSFAVKNRTGKIQPLLYVHGMSRVLQGVAHLFCYGHKPVIENLKHHRVSLCPYSCSGRKRNSTGKKKVVSSGDFTLPARFDYNGSVFFGKNCRSVYAGSGFESFHIKNRGSIQPSVAVHPNPGDRRRYCIFVRFKQGVRGSLGYPDNFYRCSFYNNGLIFHYKSEAFFMGFLKARPERFGAVCKVHRELGVRTCISHMCPVNHIYAVLMNPLFKHGKPTFTFKP